MPNGNFFSRPIFRFSKIDRISMKGGGILGEGVDGCVITKPLWPCASGKSSPDSQQNTYSEDLVSKIIKRDNMELVYLEAASRIIGKEDSNKYIAGLRSHCQPANDTHPPDKGKMINYLENKTALIKYLGDEKMACRDLKKNLLSKKGIFNTHSLIYISRYPITLYEWTNLIKKKGIPLRIIMTFINKSIDGFLDILQRFYKGNIEHLINLDIHHNNIFIKSNGQNIQFGVADFGRCILRQLKDQYSLVRYVSEYLHTNQIQYTIYTGYKQIPFEARILDFCFKKGLDNEDPSVIVNMWLNDKNNVDYASSLYYNDIIVENMKIYIKYLLTKPLFIVMIEELTEISKKMRNPSTLIYTLTNDEIILLEFITTRYMALSPIVTILDQLYNIEPHIKLEIKEITLRKFSGKTLVDLKDPSFASGIYYIVEYFNRLFIAPYISKGLSLSKSVSSVRSMDISMLWNDIISGN